MVKGGLVKNNSRSASCALTLFSLLMIFVWISVNQVVQACLFTVVFEYAVEVTYPEPEVFSGGVLMIGCNAVCLFIVVVSSFVLGNVPTRAMGVTAIGLCMGFTAFSGLICLLLHERLRRVMAENKAGSLNRAGAE